MDKKIFCKLFVMVVLFSCKQYTTQSSDKTSVPAVDSNLYTKTQSDTLHNIDSTNKNLMLVKDSTFSCHESLLLLIKSSSLDPEIKKLKFDVLIDNVDNGVVSIELTIKNEERKEDVALRWIDMDINKKELRDVTVDLDKPVQLKYDSGLFRKIVENCKLK